MTDRFFIKQAFEVERRVKEALGLDVYLFGDGIYEDVVWKLENGESIFDVTQWVLDVEDFWTREYSIQ